MIQQRGKHPSVGLQLLLLSLEGRSTGLLRREIVAGATHLLTAAETTQTGFSLQQQ
jgi:hypothetical protein